MIFSPEITKRMKGRAAEMLSAPFAFFASSAPSVFVRLARLAKKISSHKRTLLALAFIAAAVLGGPGFGPPHAQAQNPIPFILGGAAAVTVPSPATATTTTEPPSALEHVLNNIAEKIASGVTDVAYFAIGKFFFGVTYIVAFIAGVSIMLITWIIGIMLQLNNQIIQSDAVQVGFSVSLSVANLGFVFGIIVIAIMTILRQESYGLKQTLWKLVTAAILVNFSLVIVAPILNFTNQLATYFLNCATGNCLSASPDINGFATKLAGAFNPQNGLLVGIAKIAEDERGEAIVKNDLNLTGAFAEVGASVGKILIPLVSLFTTTAMLIVIIITLVAFILMLFIRYLTLGILLIIMPFAWLMWIFPNLSHLWTKWWNTFWRWTLFAPIVLFFLYLALSTASVMSQGSGPLNEVSSYKASNNSGAFAAIADVIGNALSQPMKAIMDQLLIVGLTIGGIFAANSMSIHGASAAMDRIKGMRDATVGFAAGFVGRQSKKAGRGAWRGIGGGRVTENLQKGQIVRATAAIPATLSKKFLNVGGVATIGLANLFRKNKKDTKIGDKFIGAAEQKAQKLAEETKAGKRVGKVAGAVAGVLGLKRLASIGGRGLAKVQHNKDLVDEAKKLVPKDKKEFLKNWAGSMRKELRFAYASEHPDYLDAETKTTQSGQRFADWKDENENDFENFGQGKLSDDLDTTLTNNKEIRDIAREKEKEKSAGREKKRDVLSKIDAEIKELEEKIKTEKANGDPEDKLKWDLMKLDYAKKARDHALSAIDKPIDDKYQSKLDAAQDKFNSERTKDDMRKANVNAIFGPEASKAMQEAVARGFARSAPQLVSGFIGKMKSPALANFQEIYVKQIDRLIEETDQREDIANDEKKKLLEKYKQIKDNFKNTINYNMFAIPAEKEEASGPSPKPPAAPPPAGGGGGGHTP